MYCKKVATVATNWWINLMKAQCSKLYPEKISATESDLIILDESLQEDLSRFQQVLFEKILTFVEKRNFIDFSCYYFPNSELSKLSVIANIPKDYFPRRAYMEVLGTSVKVSLNDEDLRELHVPVE